MGGGAKCVYLAIVDKETESTSGLLTSRRNNDKIQCLDTFSSTSFGAIASLKRPFYKHFSSLPTFHSRYSINDTRSPFEHSLPALSSNLSELQKGSGLDSYRYFRTSNQSFAAVDANMTPSKNKRPLPSSTSIAFSEPPETLQQWRSALGKVNILYLRGQWKYCSTQCGQLLLEAKTQVGSNIPQDPK